MTLALFDLDNTLLSGDSDYEWGQFLVDKKLVDVTFYEAENKRFYQQYEQGVLDIDEFSAFSFKFLSENSQETLTALHQEFMQTVILPLMSKKAKALVESHRRQGHTLVVITATNSFITRPIVDAFDIPYLIATEPQQVEGCYTTKIEGTACFHQGKVVRLTTWLAEHNAGLQGSYFYSDSHNDLPLLEKVETPVAVDPDETLAAIAIQRHWQQISLRD